MGREVRRVPVGWVHPKHHAKRIVGPLGGRRYLDWVEEYQPMYDETWTVAFERFLSKPDDYDGLAPDPLYYRPAWPAGIELGFQLYETVSEGTPLSPVFATTEDMAQWVVTSPNNGLAIGSRHLPMTIEQARRFAGIGYAPSMVASAETGLVSGVEYAIRE